VHWIHDLVDWYFHQINTMGLELYVFVGMTIESSFIPFPSEVIMPPAGHQAGSFLRVIWLILIGTLGSLVGAWVNYFLGLKLGRPFFEKYGKYVLISERSLTRMDHYWERYGEASTFIGRLVPAVRQLISIPAGVARMNFWRFTFYSGLGAGLWVTVLALLGWFLRDWTLERFETELKERMLPYVIVGLVVLIGGYILKLQLQKRRRRRAQQPPAETHVSE